MSLTPGTRLGPYEIVALLGAGGMGEVYRARDTRLDRDVAIKVMSAATAGDPILGQRLLREARAASALNHPHICTIHDVGNADGRPFIAMEWIDGESLAERLARKDEALAIDDLLRLASQVADALDAAHSSGIIHRDLKPANLFITKRGNAKILDFGLAKHGAGAAGGAETVAVDPNLTSPGSAVGTVAYMSPEQARGEAIDPRSDLFSLGVVLYEMAAGRSAFAGPTTAVTFDAILNRQPAPARDVRPDLPTALDQIIGRLLAKQASGRHPSARAVREEIDALRQTLRDRSSGSTRIAPSIAVLPFTNLSPEPENEYIADGITEEIINTLAQIKGLQVAARTSSFAFKGRTPDLADVAAKLRVAHVLTGSVRKAGPRLRITAQLVNTADGFPVWSERYDRTADDIFEIQDEIATAIAQKLRVALAGASEEGLVRRPTDNLSAYELYLKGRFHVNQRGAGLQKGLECFQQALALDAQYAPAHSGLASALALLGFYGYVPSYEAMPKARSAALTAIEIDATLAEPHAPLIMVGWSYDWDWALAEREYRRALALDERLVSAHQWHALHLICHGRFDEAIVCARRAVDIDPLAAASYSTLGACYMPAHRFDEAIAASQRAVELDPHIWIANRIRCVALIELGRFDEAISILETMASLSNRHHWALQDLTHASVSIGRVREAGALCEEIVDRAGVLYVPPSVVAIVLGLVDRTAEANVWLDRAYRERDTLPLWNYWPPVRHMFNGARLAEMMRRVGLKPNPRLGV